MKGTQLAWEEGEATWPSLTKGIESAMREMDILSDLAMIAWTRKKEKVRAKQARKVSMIDDGNEFEESAWEKSDNGSGRQSTRESKRDRDPICGGGGVRVGDAVEIVKMEVELEKLATKQVKDEARAGRNRQKNIKKKKGLGSMMIVFGNPGTMVIFGDQEDDEMPKKKGGKKSKSKPKEKEKEKRQSKCKAPKKQTKQTKST